MQGKLRDMERQVEWVRAERDELAAARQGAASDLASRLRDSEQALARLKVRLSCCAQHADMRPVKTQPPDRASAGSSLQSNPRTPPVCSTY